MVLVIYIFKFLIFNLEISLFLNSVYYVFKETKSWLTELPSCQTNIFFYPSYILWTDYI